MTQTSPCTGSDYPIAGDGGRNGRATGGHRDGTAMGWRYAADGWTVAAAVFTGWTWSVIGALVQRETAAHATREDPARPLTDLITLNACIASLGRVVYLLAAGSSSGGT